jgi:hypothetical protein
MSPALYHHSVGTIAVYLHFVSHWYAATGVMITGRVTHPLRTAHPLLSRRNVSRLPTPATHKENLKVRSFHQSLTEEDSSLQCFSGIIYSAYLVVKDVIKRTFNFNFNVL